VAQLVNETRAIRIGRRSVAVDDRFYRCGTCGEQFYTGDMADETLRRASAAVRHEKGLLTPDEIREIRSRYGLSQVGLARLLRTGPKTVMRWERGTALQNQAADTLLRVFRDDPGVAAETARERGVGRAL
jgi:putative zinc finger/helix-turn-helix YgiT family protein